MVMKEENHKRRGGEEEGGGKNRQKGREEGGGVSVCCSTSLGGYSKEQECIHQLWTQQLCVCQTHHSVRTAAPNMRMGPGTPGSQCSVADGERFVLSPSEEMGGLIGDNGSWEVVKF